MRNAILYQFLKDNGLTQREAAAMLGYHEAHLSRIVRGEREVSNSFLWKFEQVFVEPQSPFYLPDASTALSEMKRPVTSSEPTL